MYRVILVTILLNSTSRFCQNQEPIGGDGIIVEIDESVISRRKYNRGSRVPAKWIFGGIERGENGRAFAFRVENRSAAILIPLIEAHIRPGTIIVSDEWPVYHRLKNLGFKHFTICHKDEYARYF